MISYLQMADTEITLKTLKKKNFISLLLNLQNESDKFVSTFGQHIDKLSFALDNLSSKSSQAESSLVVTKIVNSGSLKRVNSHERVFIAKNSTTEESVWRLSA